MIPLIAAAWFMLAVGANRAHYAKPDKIELRAGESIFISQDGTRRVSTHYLPAPQEPEVNLPDQ